MRSNVPRDAAAARAAMVERQLRRRGITDERVLEAMRCVPRELFVPPDQRAHAYDDGALPIGDGQTISQPFVVAAMCQLLSLTGDERVLEVGTGSGYAAAVLAELADEVVSVERMASLAALARASLDAAGYERVEVRVGDGSLGAPDRAPFDAISVAAAAPVVPKALLAQLGEGGRMVLPLGSRAAQRLVVVTQTPSGPTERDAIDVRFVPLIGAAGFTG